MYDHRKTQSKHTLEGYGNKQQDLSLRMDFPFYVDMSLFFLLHLEILKFYPIVFFCFFCSVVSPIPESSPLSDRGGDSVSAMCQQLSQGLSLLSSNDDFLTDIPRQVGHTVGSSR